MPLEETNMSHVPFMLQNKQCVCGGIAQLQHSRMMGERKAAMRVKICGMYVCMYVCVLCAGFRTAHTGAATMLLLSRGWI
jgi:hypothetical protein